MVRLSRRRRRLPQITPPILRQRCGRRAGSEPYGGTGQPKFDRLALSLVELVLDPLWSQSLQLAEKAVPALWVVERAHQSCRVEDRCAITRPAFGSEKAHDHEAPSADLTSLQGL